jgi:hypothetical protein
LWEIARLVGFTDLMKTSPGDVHDYWEAVKKAIVAMESLVRTINGFRKSSKYAIQPANVDLSAYGTSKGRKPRASARGSGSGTASSSSDGAPVPVEKAFALYKEAEENRKIAGSEYGRKRRVSEAAWDDYEKAAKRR